MTLDPKLEQKKTTKEEPNCLKLSRSLEEQYAKSRKQPLNLSREEQMAELRARYGERK